MSPNPKPRFSRLPSAVIPTNYKITLRPDFETFTFAGTEAVSVAVRQQTDRFVLNANDIDISLATFANSDGQSVRAESVQLDRDTQTATIVWGRAIAEGTGTLHIDFKGVLNDKLCGFYRCRYRTADGEERYGASSHFEATDARRAFPCWDEPALKATFDVTLVVATNRVALSNMNAISETTLSDEPNLKEVKFATTPLMSTYLVAFIVGEYDFVEAKTRDGVLVRVYTPVAKKMQGLFALEVAVKALDHYTHYFKVGFPLPKCDLVAVPELKIGAMENWGLVTYREATLLVHPFHTSASRKQVVALIVSHELSHKWFGNLVTMEWWTDLWLKEGFANFIEYMCVDHLFPEYEIWKQFVTDAYTRALELDALHNSHPIEVPVGHPSEIDEIFDAISYDKGASVIRMLHHFVGDEAFRKGLNIYLTRHSYKNTRTEDLWDALQEASNVPVRDVMSAWTKQKGFPLVSVTARTEGQSRVLTLTQEKFSADGKVAETEQNSLWQIPIDVIRASKPNQPVKTLMKTKSVDLEIDSVADGEWIKLNSGAVGLYRIHYSPDLMTGLLPAIANRSLSPIDRLSVHNDLMALVQSGRAKTSEVLRLMTAYTDEDDLTVWQSIDDCLTKLDNLLSETDLLPQLHKYGRKLLASVHSRLGWEPTPNESHLNTLLRSVVLNQLVSLEEPSVISHINTLFKNHIDGSTVIVPDLRSAVYRAVALDCDDHTFETLINLYKQTELNEEKIRLARGLGNVRDPKRLRRVLEFSLSNEVKSQDSVFVIISVSTGSSTGRQLAWQFFTDNVAQLRKRYEGGLLMSRMIKRITEDFTSEAKAQEVMTFFDANPIAGAERSVRQAVEKVKLNSDWLNRDLNDIRDYLSANV